MQITGLDLSLTATGIARLAIAANESTIEMETIGSARDKCAKGTRHCADEILSRSNRITDLRSRIVQAAIPSDLVVIEGPSLGHGTGHVWDRAGLWWLVVSWLADDTPVAVLPPTTLKKFATGSGAATKADMRVAWLQRQGDDVRDDNQVDAAWLACAGAHWLGTPVLALPKTHIAALDKGDWPAADVRVAVPARDAVQAGGGLGSRAGGAA